jgi:hypothetical protein
MTEEKETKPINLLYVKYFTPVLTEPAGLRPSQNTLQILDLEPFSQVLAVLEHQPRDRDQRRGNEAQ